MSKYKNNINTFYFFKLLFMKAGKRNGKKIDEEKYHVSRSWTEIREAYISLYFREPFKRDEKTLEGDHTKRK